MTTEVIDEMRQFQLFVPFEKQHSLEELDLSKSYAENADGTLTIEGIACNLEIGDYIFDKHYKIFL